MKKNASSRFAIAFLLTFLMSVLCSNASEYEDIVGLAGGLSNGQVIENINDGNAAVYSIELPYFIDNLSVETFGGSGDAELYIKRGAIPTEFDYDCRSTNDGNGELCHFPNAPAGNYYVVIKGQYQELALSAKWETTVTNMAKRVNAQTSSCNGDAACVENYNRNKRTGHISTAVIPIRWIDTEAKIIEREDIDYLQRFYHRISRGKVALKGISSEAENIDILPAVESGLLAECYNRKEASQKAKGVDEYKIRIFAYDGNVCGFAGNAGSKAINIMRSTGNGALMSHEMGHTFHLGHSGTLKSYKDRLVHGSADKTTSMGSWGSNSYNAPQLHWLGFFDSHEAVKVNPTIEGQEFTLRVIDNNSKTGETPLALVYEMPHTGNRLFMSIAKLKKKKSTEEFLGVNLHVASPCKFNCSHMETMRVGAVRKDSYHKHGKKFDGVYIDETGLKIEVLEHEKNWSSAKIRLSMVEPIQSCMVPPTINASFSLIKSIEKSSRGRGKGKMQVEVINNNSMGCRPITIMEKGLKMNAPDGLDLRSRRTSAGRKFDKNRYIWSEGDKTKKGDPGHKRFSTIYREMYLYSSETQNFDVSVQVGNLPPIIVPVVFSEANEEPIPDPEPNPKDIKIEAENYDAKRGSVRSESRGGVVNLGHIKSGNWVKYSDIQFSNSYMNRIDMSIATRTRYSSGSIKVYLDRLSGTFLGELKRKSGPGGWGNFETHSVDLKKPVTGTHDIYLKFKSGYNLDHFTFSRN